MMIGGQPGVPPTGLVVHRHSGADPPTTGVDADSKRPPTLLAGGRTPSVLKQAPSRPTGSRGRGRGDLRRSPHRQTTLSQAYAIMIATLRYVCSLTAAILDLMLATVIAWCRGLVLLRKAPIESNGR